ncbi:TonB-dependent receptor [Bacteroides bouchesdurhonensis]
MKYIILSLFSLLAFDICGQVRGIVKDNTGEPVPGANIFWLNTGQGVTTKEDGSFSIHKPAKEHMLVVSFIGFQNDTIHVSNKNDELDIVLQDGVELNEISVVRRKMGTMKIRNSVLNEDIITSAELSRAACCNLGESFVTNPSVDVSYSDAATGAKQIKLLGLSGTYVQMLTENIPNYRGAASPYGLGYVPGPWMQSIQVSKGTSSVKNGYEAITGQINVEFKKPQLPEADWVFANLFASSTNRYEANADATLKVSKRWSTSLLAHYENETKAHDGNNDGFVDIPQVEQYNVWNRWAYMGDHYVFQAGFKALSESRNSGQTHHGNMLASDLYKVGIDTERYELFTKNAYIFNKEKNTNLALILSATWHNQDALYGKKLYNVDQTNAYASLMFETELNKQNSISTGLSFNYDAFDQYYRLENDAEGLLRKAFDKEAVPGAYVQYTLNLNDQWMFMAGLRGDYSNEHGFFMTPRAHLKYNPNEYVHFRLSAGKGYRTNHVLAENNYLLSSSRKVTIAQNLDIEEAWNYGASVATYIPIFGKTLNINAEYYYTNFLKQVIVDMDSNPHEVSFYNLDGRSYSHVFQVEASYPFFKGFTLTGAYRLTDAQTTYKGQRMEKPLTSKYKGLLTASYQTPMGIWQLDATLQLNGGGRMPSPYELADGRLSWERRYGSFEQVSAQITRYFRRWSIYVGGENLTNFKQKNPIIDASNPWGDNFDSTMIWGPVHGAKAYIGVRFNLARN